MLLPLRVALPAGGPAPAGPLTIEAEASWLVCAEICIPEEGRFRLDLPVAAAGRLEPRGEKASPQEHTEATAGAV